MHQTQITHCVSSFIVAIYKLWHGTLHLRGAGWILGFLAKRVRFFQKFPLLITPCHCIFVDFRDVSAFYWLNWLCGDKFEEFALLKALSNLKSSCEVFWDIGSNCGLLSYQLLTNTQKITLFYFEPNPKMYALSKQVLEPIGAKGFDLALSDELGSKTMIVPCGSSTKGSLEESTPKENADFYEVQQITGDELVETDRALAPCIIKIDTEGHEEAVLRGLQKTIARYHPVIFFEHLSLTDEAIKKMIPKNYSLFSISDNNGELFPKFDRNVGHNSVLVPNLIE